MTKNDKKRNNRDDHVTDEEVIDCFSFFSFSYSQTSE
jgi:hypothetical protein